MAWKFFGPQPSCLDVSLGNQYCFQVNKTKSIGDMCLILVANHYFSMFPNLKLQIKSLENCL